MNFVQDNLVIQALRLSETINSREEMYIPLYKLKIHIERLMIDEYYFKEYLYSHAPSDERHYINEVVQKLYHSVIDKDEAFKITSGLR